MASSNTQPQPVPRPRHIPERSCVACRQVNPKRALIRLVRTSEGRVEIDPTGKKAGRGAYLCADATCWGLALKRDRLSRSLRVKVLPEDQRLLAAHAATLPLLPNSGEPDIDTPQT